MLYASAWSYSSLLCGCLCYVSTRPGTQERDFKMGESLIICVNCLITTGLVEIHVGLDVFVAVL